MKAADVDRITDWIVRRGLEGGEQGTLQVGGLAGQVFPNWPVVGEFLGETRAGNGKTEDRRRVHSRPERDPHDDSPTKCELHRLASNVNAISWVRQGKVDAAGAWTFTGTVSAPTACCKVVSGALR